MKSLAILSLAATLLMGACVQAGAEQLQTMDDVGAAIQACWTPPPGIPNSWVTLSFSFKRDGSLMGPPKPTATDVKGGDAAKQAFVDAAVQGFGLRPPRLLTGARGRDRGCGLYDEVFVT